MLLLLSSTEYRINCGEDISVETDELTNVDTSQLLTSMLKHNEQLKYGDRHWQETETASLWYVRIFDMYEGMYENTSLSLSLFGPN